MRQYNRIILALENSFVSKFVRRYLETGAVEKPEHILTPGDDPEEFPQLLVISDPYCTAEQVRRTVTGKIAKRAVLLSTTEIYDVTEGENLNELTPLKTESERFRAENAAAELCAEYDIPLTILRLPELIVGTGMDGTLMDIVRYINRGTYLHIKGSVARRSVIHAASVGPAIAESVPGIFNIADNAAPEVREIAEALAFRTGQKRIYSVSLPLARKMSRIAPLLGIGGWKKDMLRFKTESLTFSTSKAESAFGFNIPQSATDYLRNHIYDESSL